MVGGGRLVSGEAVSEGSPGPAQVRAGVRQVVLGRGPVGWRLGQHAACFKTGHKSKCVRDLSFYLLAVRPVLPRPSCGQQGSASA